jgi:ribonuclease PH
MRPVSLERAVARHAEGSCVVRFGDTHVLCTASLDEKVPPWLRGGGFVEIQATAEGKPFSDDEFAALQALARTGIAHLVELQKLAIL